MTKSGIWKTVETDDILLIYSGLLREQLGGNPLQPKGNQISAVHVLRTGYTVCIWSVLENTYLHSYIYVIVGKFLYSSKLPNSSLPDGFSILCSSGFYVETFARKWNAILRQMPLKRKGKYVKLRIKKYICCIYMCPVWYCMCTRSSRGRTFLRAIDTCVNHVVCE